MIAFVKGIIEDLTEENVVVDVNGVGYNVKISERTAEELPGIGKEVKLYTYTSVREDAFWLYGFLTRDELFFYKQLITVTGIGPKGGLAILSVFRTDDLRFAIISGDAKTIARAPGIGKKTAERLILDLKDKISMEDTLMHREIEGQSSMDTEPCSDARREAIAALTALGYSLSDATKAVQKANAPMDADTETILKLALKAIY